MGIDRRKFLALAGLTTFAAFGKKALGSSLEEHSASHSDSPTVKRWAMLVDMQKCRQHEGCRECTIICHKIHNVPDFGNPKDEIKWIWKEDFEAAFPTQDHNYLQTEVKENPVIILCNHCDSPPCVRVCPTKSTWKREDGIVMMDMHRCIGCRYCVAGCPYGSRSFNWRDPRPFIKEINPEYPTRSKGVVEKCTFCAERLALDQHPACVEICPEKAMIFGDINNPESEIREILKLRHSIRRKPSLGTNPQVYYLV
jgi:Fe-S-cluster-containing dehydrogenase component